MVEIQSKPGDEVHSEPEEINPNNVQFWCRHTKELKKTQVSKALKFVNYDCIKYIGNKMDNMDEIEGLKKLHYPDARHVFLCLPLNTNDSFNFFGQNLEKKPYPVNYNNSEYIIFRRSDGTFECNCQCWQSKKKKDEIILNGANCSHILALFYTFKMKKFSRGEI